ncbi:glycosyltransferase family 2 protein [Urechidicola vernalis]|uniref:Glycosyltransferase family 2 protein n=1 Tax=Urechidicola vernalis TaxID=3075600 RepID=A0ABU2Y281_9FLAO|nr:glycosyltransferase family 2 protein [Urechidicola sp. P050]MDT0552271.1 glycosyltransferase family 2 protein [Urechidicola sp. P050]
MLAIVIPFYNIDFFKETLDSLKNQTNQNFRVYIGNDGSMSDLSELISFYNEHIEIHYRNFPDNLGAVSLVSHWNRCMSLLSNEDWVCILGDDDMLSSTVVDEFYSQFELVKKKGVAVVRLRSQLIDDSGGAISEVYEHPTIESSIGSFEKVFYKQSRSSLSEYVFSRNVYERFGFFDFPLAWHSDDLAWLTFSNFGTIYTLSNCKAMIRLSSVNISGQSDNFRLKRKASVAFYRKLLGRYPFRFKHSFREELLKELVYLVDKTKNYTLKNSTLIIVHLLWMLKVKLALGFLKKAFKSNVL